MKTCTKCKTEKELIEFCKHKNRPDGLSCWCRLCSSENSKKYALENKDKRNKYRKKYVLKNKEKIRKYNKAYARHRRESDPIFKLKNVLRVRISDVLKGRNKSVSTIKFIGCSDIFLKNYLEQQFTVGMSWDNHGHGWGGKGMKEWHIDHIKPCASFDLSKPEEQSKCFHYTNLQPLWAKDNMEKRVALDKS